VKPSILGRGAALDGLESQGAKADAIGPRTDRVDQRSVLVKPATLDVSFGDVVSMSALLPTANMTPWSTCGGNRETRISAFV
jgi:hypothetical protein